MRGLLENPYVSVWVERGVGGLIYVVRRSHLPFETLDQMRRIFSELIAVLDRAGRVGACLFIDTREAPPRNDAGFEAAFTPLRRALLAGFLRVAVVANTTVGKLQIERHLREDGIRNARLFSDENEARRFCNGLV